MQGTRRFGLISLQFSMPVITCAASALQDKSSSKVYCKYAVVAKFVLRLDSAHFDDELSIEKKSKGLFHRELPSSAFGQLYLRSMFLRELTRNAFSNRAAQLFVGALSSAVLAKM